MIKGKKKSLSYFLNLYFIFIPILLIPSLKIQINNIIFFQFRIYSFPNTDHNLKNVFNLLYK